MNNKNTKYGLAFLLLLISSFSLYSVLRIRSSDEGISTACLENQAVLIDNKEVDYYYSISDFYNNTINKNFETLNYCGSVIHYESAIVEGFYTENDLSIESWSIIKPSESLYELPKYLNIDTVHKDALLPGSAYDFPLLSSDDLNAERNDWISNRIPQKGDPAGYYESTNGIVAFYKSNYCKYGSECEVGAEYLINRSGMPSGTAQNYIKLNIVIQESTEQKEIEAYMLLKKFIDSTNI